MKITHTAGAHTAEDRLSPAEAKAFFDNLPAVALIRGTLTPKLGSHGHQRDPETILLGFTVNWESEQAAMPSASPDPRDMSIGER